MATIIITLILWYITGIITALLGVYFLEPDTDITYDDLYHSLTLGLIGPIVILFMLATYFKKNKNKIIIKRKNK